MDTPLHAQALPDADPATLKQPADAAQEMVALLVALRATARNRHRMSANAEAPAADIIAAAR
jgi:hypothetical protein